MEKYSRIIKLIKQFSSFKLVILLIIGTGTSLGIGSIFPLFSIVIGNFANIFAEFELGTVSKDEYNNKIDYQMWSFIVLTAISFACSSVDYFVWQTLGEIYRVHFSKQLLENLLAKSTSWTDTCKKTLPELHTSYLTDGSELKAIITSQIPTIIKAISTFVCGCGVAFSKSAVLSLIILSTVPVTSIIYGILRWKSSAIQQAAYKVNISAFGGAHRAFSAIKLVQSSNAGNSETKLFEQKTQLGESLLSRNQYFQCLSQSLGVFLIYSMFALGFYIGAQLVSQSKLTPGGVISVFLPCFYGAQSLQNGLKVFDGFSKSLDNITFSLGLVLNAAPKLASLKSESIAHFFMSNVSFAYPNRPDKKVLDNVSFEFTSERTIAIVGSSGSGKTTVAQILAKLYQQTSGTTSWSDISEAEWFTQYISYVEQEPRLYDVSIRENIAYGLPEFSEAVQKGNELLKHESLKIKIENACRVAGVHDDIEKLENGYDTRVGEGGHLLSGGQKQRICIARALLKSPKLLILDEATSAIEAEAEERLAAAVHETRKHLTTVIVAHRYGAISHADLVYKLAKGKILETGTLQQLGFLTDSLKRPQSLLSANDLVFDDDECDTSTQSSPVRYSFRSESLDNSSLSSPVSLFEKADSVSTSGSNKHNIAILKKPAKIKPLRLIFDIAYNECGNKWLVAVGLFASLASTFGMPLYSIILSKILFAYTLQGSTAIINETLLYVLYLLLLAVALATFLLVQLLALYLSAGSMLFNLRTSLFRYIVCKQPMAFFDSTANTCANLIYQLAYNTTQVYGLLPGLCASAISVAFTAILGGVFAFVYGWKLSLVGVGCFPLWIGAAKLQSFLSFRTERHAKSLRLKANSVSLEAVLNFSATKLLGLSPLFCHKVETNLNTAAIFSIKSAAIIAPISGLSMSMLYLMEAVVFRFGAYLISTGEYDLQTMMTVWVILIITADAVIRTSSAMSQTSSTFVAAEHLSRLLALKKNQVPAYSKYSKQNHFAIYEMQQIAPPAESSQASPIRYSTNCIEFNNVCFSYPETPNAVVLDSVCFDITENQTIAIMGASGCGKSTLASLLLKFYEPTSGSINFLGKSLQLWDSEQLRSKIGLVLQDPVLFDTTIAGNIAYGQAREFATTQDIIAAAKRAQIHDFIMSLPDKYNTRVFGSSEIKMSGGQKQRLAIARALIRKPPVLILDEATSSLDSQTESDLLQALATIDYPCTKIIIAHRKACLERADLIVSMKSGKVVAIGAPKNIL